jgi:hypothetical protein
LSGIGFTATISDPCVFHRPDAPNRPATWIFAHVDDLVIISRDPLRFKSEIESEFNIKYLGQAEFLLGMNINRAPGYLHIHQTQYIKRKLSEYGLEDASIALCPLNPKSHLRAATSHDMAEFQKLGVSYHALIGSLNYLSVLTRPDVSYAVSVLSQHLENPGMTHFRATQQVFCYLKGTKQVGLLFQREPALALNCHVDADWGNFPDTRRSVTVSLGLLCDYRTQGGGNNS